MGWTTLQWFNLFLRLSEKAFKRVIDLYNHGLLPENARLALEAIEAIDE